MPAQTVLADDLPCLLQQLSTYLPFSLKVYGELKSHLEGKWPGVEFVVDTWPEFQVVLTKPDPAKVKSAYIANACSVFATNPEAFRDLLQQPGVFNWSSTIVFAGIEESLWPVIEEATHSAGGTLEQAGAGTGFIYTVSSQSLQLQPTPVDVILSTLTSKEAEFVQKRWKHSQPGVDSFISAQIENFPSISLVDQHGKVLGYVMTYHYGAIGLLYVEPACRGKGYGKFLLSYGTKVNLELGRQVFSVIEHDNFVSQKMHKALGFRRIPDFNVSWFSYFPRGYSQDAQGRPVCCV